MNLDQPLNLFRNEWGAAGATVLLVVILLFAFLIHKFSFKILEKWAQRLQMPIGHMLYKPLYNSTQYVLLIFSVIIISPVLGISFNQAIDHILTILLIASVANLLIKSIAFGRSILISRYDLTSTNKLYARKVFTQFKIIERIAVFLIILIAIATSLMTFDQIWQIGISLLASAGIVGIIVGFAAQKSLGTLLAGIQTAIAQPIKMGDSVIVEGEFGIVEEITLTYVSLKLWDQRRLIVPINYFLDKPFQNWTRNETEITGTVLLYVDYTASVDLLRIEFNRIIASTPLWNNRVSALQVTNVTERTTEIRMIVSASNSDKSLDLCCLLREKMINFLQKNYPQSLPRMRMDLDHIPEGLTTKTGQTAFTSLDAYPKPYFRD